MCVVYVKNAAILSPSSETRAPKIKIGRTNGKFKYMSFTKTVTHTATHIARGRESSLTDHAPAASLDV